MSSVLSFHPPSSEIHGIGVVMTEKSEGDEYIRSLTYQATKEQCGVSQPGGGLQPLRPPPKAHPLASRHSGYIGSASKRSPTESASSRSPQHPGNGVIEDDQRMQSYQRSSYPSANSYIEELGGNKDDKDTKDDEPKRHVVWILVYLSALAPLLSIPVAVYTIVMTVLLLVLSPFLLFQKQRSISSWFYRFLAPLPHFQLGLIFSLYDPNASTIQGLGDIKVLVLANTFAPLCAMFIAGAAWTAGIFWGFTAIMGNPDGKDQRDDGRDAVLRVRVWWERWLIQGLD